MLTLLVDNPLFESWLGRFGLAAARILEPSSLEAWAFVS
jgi:hypothetical protein